MCGLGLLSYFLPSCHLISCAKASSFSSCFILFFNCDRSFGFVFGGCFRSGATGSLPHLFCPGPDTFCCYFPSLPFPFFTFPAACASPCPTCTAFALVVVDMGIRLPRASRHDAESRGRHCFRAESAFFPCHHWPFLQYFRQDLRSRLPGWLCQSHCRSNRRFPTLLHALSSMSLTSHTLKPCGRPLSPLFVIFTFNSFHPVHWPAKRDSEVCSHQNFGLRQKNVRPPSPFHGQTLPSCPLPKVW